MGGCPVERINMHVSESISRDLVAEQTVGVSGAKGILDQGKKEIGKHRTQKGRSEGGTHPISAEPEPRDQGGRVRQLRKIKPMEVGPHMNKTT